jgi:hypothetical protein
MKKGIVFSLILILMFSFTTFMFAGGGQEEKPAKEEPKAAAKEAPKAEAGMKSMYYAPLGTIPKPSKKISNWRHCKDPYQ